jgi:predicted nucleotidyltransferase component of viral defense system
MIEDKYIDLYAANSKVPVGIARQEVILTYALALMDESGLLPRLAFKGGTCLRKVIFGKQYRFSEDLDFTIVRSAKPQALLREIQEVFSSPFYDISFHEVQGSARVTTGGIGVQFEYQAPSANGAFDLEISFRAEPILPVMQRPLQEQSYFKQLEVSIPGIYTMALEEIVSERIRATFHRTRPRDIYDLYSCFQRSMNLHQLKGLVLIKCWQVRDPFEIDRFIGNLHSTKYNWDELDYFLPKGGRPGPEKMIKLIEAKAGMFQSLSDEEKKIIADSRRHKCVRLIESTATRLRSLGKLSP